MLWLILACSPDPVDTGYAADSACLRLVGWADDDGDGFGDPLEPREGCVLPPHTVDNRDDCDDLDPLVHPDAAEVCNDVDDDCDRLVDEDDDDLVPETTWYEDLDQDGFGDQDAPVSACEQPQGTTLDDTDCNDSVPTIHPGALERCNGVDDDCDGELDEDPVDPLTWYADADSDGFGDQDVPTEACDALTGFVADASDCDDADPTTYPDADEYCNGHDDDCDGDIDEDDSVDALTWHQDVDRDGFGDPAITSLACAQPKRHVADATDCDDEDADTNPAADEYCDGQDDDCDGTIDEDDALDARSWYDDTDLDGYGDPDTATVQCDAPSGYVADGSDCDDTDDGVNPAAIEVCNDIEDDDCDASTPQTDMATFIDNSGNETDVSSNMNSEYTLKKAGTLRICDGEFDVNLVLDADITVMSQSGDATAVVLDGDVSNPVIRIEDEGVIATVQDITVRNGSGMQDSSDENDAPFGFTLGGGIRCYGDDPIDLTLSNVIFEDNDAYAGGGLALVNCDLTGSDLLFDGNSAAAGSAIFASEDSDVALSDTEMTGNSAELGTLVGYYHGTSPTLELDEVLIDSNHADQAAAVYLYASELTWTGTATTSSGATNNTSSYESELGLEHDGAVYLVYSSWSFEADTVDFGTDAGGDDNDAADVYIWESNHGYLEYALGDDATFTCDGDGCGDLDTTEVGGTTESLEQDGLYLAVIEPSNTATLVEFEAALGETSDCDEVQLVAAAATSASATSWEVVHVSDADVDDALVSGQVGVSMDADHAWAVGYRAFCDDGDFTVYMDSSTGSTDAGFGTSSRLVHTTTDPGELEVGDTVTLKNTTGYGSPGIGLELAYQEL